MQLNFVLRLSLIGALSFTLGCKDSASTPASGTLRVGIMPKLIGIEYFNACEAGAREAAKELGIEVIFDGPTTDSHDGQVKMLDTWIAKKFDVIAIAPNDPEAMKPTIEKARGRGIHVLTFDADATNSEREYFVNQATYEAVAKSMIDIMHEAIGDEGRYVILTGNLTAANQNIWMEKMGEYRKATYPKMVDLSEGRPYATKEDSAIAKQVAGDVLDSVQGLQGMFAITSVALPGAAEALRDKKMADKVFLTGLATPNVMKEYVKDGTVGKFALWSPVDLGYLTVHAARLLREGKLQEGAIKAGRLGDIEVRGREVLLGPPMVFTKDNIDQFDF
jgi:rhamnose transport system substrate-binding protein